MASAALPLRARARVSSIFLSGGEVTIRSDTLSFYRDCLSTINVQHTRIWLPLQLVLPITGSKWQKVLDKVSVLLCVALSASNALAQTSVCPPPWSNAKFVYGEIMLKGKASTTANGQT